MSLDTYRPFEDDRGLIDGFIVSDVWSINRTLVGFPTHHSVGLGGGTGWTGTDYVHGDHTKLIGRTYRERNEHSQSAAPDFSDTQKAE